MKGTKFLTESVDITELERNVMNLVVAPPGAGKTFWILNDLVKTVSNPSRMLFLIDTTNGKEQMINSNPDTVCKFDNIWEGINWRELIWFDEGEYEGLNKSLAITYAKFGALVKKDRDFGKRFELIICDELQNLINFENIS